MIPASESFRQKGTEDSDCRGLGVQSPVPASRSVSRSRRPGRRPASDKTETTPEPPSPSRLVRPRHGGPGAAAAPPGDHSPSIQVESKGKDSMQLRCGPCRLSPSRASVASESVPVHSAGRRPAAAGGGRFPCRLAGRLGLMISCQAGRKSGPDFRPSSPGRRPGGHPSHGRAARAAVAAASRACQCQPA
jgi:hypothetical protein